MKIHIIGSGITGLTLGNLLNSKGINFDIYEKNNEFSKISTGIQLGSNAIAILKKLKSFDKIDKLSIKTKKLNVFNNKLRKINQLDISNADNQPSFFIRRSDLIKTLSAEIIRSKKIRFVEFERQKYADKHDIVVNCGGIQHNKNSIPTKFLGIWGISNHTNKLFKELNLFMFSGMHFVSYPLTNNQTSFTIVLRKDLLSNDIDQVAIIKKLNEKFPEDLLRLINNAEHIITKEISYSSKTQWTSEACINIGDAAHHIAPHFAQGAAQGIIDAYVLSSSLDNDISTAVKSLEMRTKFIDKLRYHSNLNRQIYHLGFPLNLYRDIFIKLFTPDYNWIFKKRL